MAETLSESLQAENRRLNQRLHELAAVMAMPAARDDLGAGAIAEGLLDTLFGMLDLDVAHLQLDGADQGGMAAFIRIAPAIAASPPTEDLSALLATVPIGSQQRVVAG